MKIALLGGGGFRTPYVYHGLLGSRITTDELVLHDLEPQRLDRIARVLRGMARERGSEIPFATTTDLEQAVEGADVVLCAVRPGGLRGRAADERIPIRFGVLGQETVGPGGICYALRTIPVLMRMAEVVARRAPRAWFINFTNPVGMVTEALWPALGDRLIGICDGPSVLFHHVARTLERPVDGLWFDYFGLNHLGWLQSVRGEDEDLLPGLLADQERLETVPEGRMFDGDWLRTLGMIPNQYLYYYYSAPESVAATLEAGQTRGEYLLQQQTGFYQQCPEDSCEALGGWQATARQREETYMQDALVLHAPNGDACPVPVMGQVGGYEAVALAVIEALAMNSRAIMVLNVANRSSLPFLDPQAVVEVPCIVGAAGVVPIAIGEVPGHARALIEIVKEVERTTIRAALTNSRPLAVQAIADHPVVPSVAVASQIFAAYLEAIPELRERFA
jgi:6-phospho-beta-glucosidase